MRIVLHREIPADPQLQSQWNALLDSMESAEIFYTYQWAWAMQRAYGTSLIPFLVLLYEGDDLLGVASLATDPGQQEASFLAATTGDYCELLSHPSRRQTLADAVFAQLAESGTKRIALANLPADSTTPAAIRAAGARHGYRLFTRHAYDCAQVQLGVGEARSALKTDLRRKKMYRRNMNALGREGPVKLSHLRSAAEVEQVLDPFAIAHVARFLATGRISNLARADRRLFLAELARTLSADGSLTLTRLMVGDRPIAWNYGFQFRGSWFWYQPTFDSALEQQSPGYCLLSNIIVEACDSSDMRLIDLGLGAEGYKERFATGTRETLHATASTSFGDYLATAARYGVARSIQSVPWLERMVRRGLHRLGNAHQRFRQTGVREFLAWGRHRAWSLLSSRDEVFFYQWPADSTAKISNALQLVPLTLELLAKAAIDFEGDQETSSYLLRSAQRFRAGESEGFASVDESGKPVHFAWAAAFDGFYMDELNTRLEGPRPNAAMIFDCWTPVAVRGQGYYAATVSLLAHRLARAGKDPWIFSAVRNQSSVTGLASSGFQKRYCLVRRKTFLLQRLAKVPLAAPAEVPVGS